MTYMPFLSDRERARMYERLAARGLATEAADHRHELLCVLADLEHALAALKDVGVDVKDAAATLHTEISKRDADLCKAIDNAGEWFAPLDLSELRALAK